MTSVEHSESTKPRAIIVIAGWAYGVFAGLGGLGFMREGHALSGALLLLSAILALPIQSISGIFRQKWIRWGSVVALFLAAAIVFPEQAEPERMARSDSLTPEANGTAHPALALDPRAVAFAKLLTADDFRGYLNGEKSLGDWPNILTIGQPVGASQLYSAYHANEIAADESYKGKLLFVSGYIESINKDMFDNGYLVLRDTNEFEGVHADLSEESVKYSAHLSRGEQAHLSCTGAGMVVGSPILKNCKISQIVFTGQQSKLEDMADTFFAGTGDQLPDGFRRLLGVGYALGINLPSGSSCETATVGAMKECLTELHTVPKEKILTGYSDLSKVLALPAIRSTKNAQGQ